MKTYAIIKTQFQAIHQWLGCDINEVKFLQYPHHHYFNVFVKIQQFHSDRDVEYIVTQLKLDDYIQERFLNENIDLNVSTKIAHIGTRSCEMIAEELLSFVQNLFVKEDMDMRGNRLRNRLVVIGVYEDNRNGAEVSND